MEDSKAHALNDRIAIIGAGAAGLTAAETLREKGYTNITVFERAERVGGKCCTVEVAGSAFELGAGIVAANNLAVLRLVKKFGVRLERAVFGKSITVGVNGASVTRSLGEKFRLVWEGLVVYPLVLLRFRQVARPGFANISEDLSLPFEQFARRYHFQELAKEFGLFFTGFGYGFAHEVPAAYALKYFSWGAVWSFLTRRIYTFPEGIQNLWRVIAKGHDVRLRASISSIQREDVVTVKVGKIAETFDSIIIASPLDELVKIMDLTEDERKKFLAISYVDYRTVLCWLKDFPSVSGYVPENFSPQRIGKPVYWYHRFLDKNIYTFYVIGDGKISDDAVKENVEQFVGNMGGEVETFGDVTKWKYFPHVSSATMQAGYFTNLEALQGQRHTYYVGETLNFSTVGCAAEYAEYVVRKYF